MKTGAAPLVMASIVLACTGPVTTAQRESAESADLHVGFDPISFVNVNLTDAKAAFRVLTRSVGEKKGYNLNVTVHTFEDQETFAAAVTNHSLHLVVMTAWEFLSCDLEHFLEPRFLATDAGQGPREYLLLVSKESPIQDIKSLRGKHVCLLENTNCEMSRPWFETLLLERGLGRPEAFLGRMGVAAKTTGALLPVFFGKADACVVSRPAFDMMRELNPQLGRRLRTVAVSAPLIDSVTFMAREGWDRPQHRTDMAESLATLHETPQGKQILTLFKVDRMASYEAHFMAGTRALKEKHDRLVATEEAP
jgi:ABC-type phosphate/phosphonate transport system substrate-binding protein